MSAEHYLEDSEEPTLDLLRAGPVVWLACEIELDEIGPLSVDVRITPIPTFEGCRFEAALFGTTNAERATEFAVRYVQRAHRWHTDQRRRYG